MVIGAQSKRNVYLKFCMKEQDEPNNCKYSVCRNHSHCCDVHYSLFNVLEQKMMKRGPNDLDEIIDRLKKENKRLKKVYNEKNKKKQRVRA